MTVSDDDELDDPMVWLAGCEAADRALEELGILESE